MYGRSTIAEVWLVAGKEGINTKPPDLDKVPFGDLTCSAAHWLDARTILWRVPAEDQETGVAIPRDCPHRAFGARSKKTDP